ncbi:ABC transporter substrate-binding protein [Ornithinimicrobium sediminis]|uniref:ABC transporter substrate-binding protein n=1 Tax=Ornithinimicrobium sediminis TaxID=2904603 RepID=UPI001E3F80FC|nr:ABC transporter substrate-binding protein [Ornithinimicrobium sediminis]MCE0487983.1 ABC transporter substrate-binding protein [Ornithinimicrobium sediminis]
MPSRKTSRRFLALTAGMATITLAACGGSDDGDDGGDAGAGADVTSNVDCAAFEEYGDLEGTSVSVYTSIISPEDQPHIDSYVPFEECTGATVNYEGSREFEAQLQVRLQAGNPPDIAYIPQPGLIRTIAEGYPDVIQPVGEQAEANVDEHFDEQWKEYGTVDGSYYGAPLGANAKSFVWYSPSMFEEAGYEIPTTLDELMELTETIASEQESLPWCAGIESGSATGWPATDWLEDMMLRVNGPEVYDQWTNHEIPFDDPQVVEALDAAGEILKNPDYVNGGLGDVRSIATTGFGDAGLPILDGNCWMMRQASFYQANWPEDVTVAEDGDVFAFYLPSTSADDQPLLVGGEFTVSFSDRPEVEAFQAYLTSPEWSDVKAQTSGPGWVSANRDMDPANLESPIDQLSYELFADENTVLRFDASDLMPAEVGAGTFWSAMTDWIALDESSEDVLSGVESSWPSE